MLARTVAPTADFHELARYFLNGKTGTPSPDRVAWSRPFNLPTDDVLLAADLMAASSRLNPRTTKPCYHLMVGWAPHEKPTPEQMQTIAVETLQRAGLSEHQAFIMGHGDTEHDHLHMMINRVHPETGEAWKPSHDWRLFDRIMRELADEHGFQFVPAKSFNPDLTRHERTKPGRNATYAAKRGANTTRPQWSRAEADAYGARLSSRLDPASTWEDLAHLVAADGLTLAPKGKGYVVGNADAYVKLSALGLSRTAKGVAYRPSRQAPPRPPATHSVFTVDGVDIAKGLAAWGLATQDTVRAAIDDAKAARVTRDAQRAPLMRRLLATTTLTQPKPPARPRRRSQPPNAPSR